MVIRVFNSQGLSGHLERTKGVHHHGQLFGAFLPNAAFVGAWMRTVWNARRMQGNISSIDARAAHEIAINVIEHFVGVNVRMIVWRWDGLRMVIVQTWHKAANHQ